jgi:hypothetical protein
MKKIEAPRCVRIECDGTLANTRVYVDDALVEGVIEVVFRHVVDELPQLTLRRHVSAPG